MNCLPALPPELTIYAVGDLHRTWWSILSKPMETDADLVLDASAVREVDSAGLQLLLALRSHCRLHDQVLRLDQPSTALQEGAAALGLQALLAAPVAAGAAQ